MVVLDLLKVLIFTLVSPELWSSCTNGEVSKVRWCLRAMNGVLAGCSCDAESTHSERAQMCDNCIGHSPIDRTEVGNAYRVGWSTATHFFFKCCCCGP